MNNMMLISAFSVIKTMNTRLCFLVSSKIDKTFQSYKDIYAVNQLLKTLNDLTFLKIL